MNIENMSVAVRPRSPSEAIDLGFVMARNWWKRLALAWFLVATPIFLISHIVFADRLWLAILIVWWCKPLYEQLPLFLLSRYLFGQFPSYSEYKKSLFSITLRQAIANLTWRRFNPSRSFDAPVT